MRKLYTIDVIHPCGHTQPHSAKGYSYGQAEAVVIENYQDRLCDACLDATGTRGNPQKLPVWT